MLVNTCKSNPTPGKESVSWMNMCLFLVRLSAHSVWWCLSGRLAFSLKSSHLNKATCSSKSTGLWQDNWERVNFETSDILGFQMGLSLWSLHLQCHKQHNYSPLSTKASILSLKGCKCSSGDSEQTLCTSFSHPEMTIEKHGPKSL